MNLSMWTCTCSTQTNPESTHMRIHISWIPVWAAECASRVYDLLLYHSVKYEKAKTDGEGYQNT